MGEERRRQLYSKAQDEDIHSDGNNNLNVNIQAVGATSIPVSIVSVSDTPEFFEDTSFVTGDSPIVLDLNAALGRNATDCLIINDGAGNFTYALSVNGSDFGDEITLKKNEWKAYRNISVDSIRITWVADSAYRVEAI